MAAERGMGVVAALSLCVAACAAPAGNDVADTALYELATGIDRAASWPETARLDFGAAETRRFLVSGFDERLPEGEVWRSHGREVVVRAQVAVPRDTRLVVRARARGSEQTPMVVAVNGTPVGEIGLGERYREHAIDVAAPAWAAGENRISLAVAGDAALPEVVDWDWIALERAGRFDGAGAELLPGAGDGRVALPFGTRLDIALEVPPDARLRIDELAGTGARGHLEATVLVDGEDGPARIAGATFEVGGDPVDLALGAGGNDVIRLSLLALPDPGAGSAVRDGTLLISGARITAAAPAEPLAVASSRPEAEAGPVIVFMVDTLRADRLGAYGYDRPTSPAIDRFAAGALLFEEAIATSSWTKPTVASVFTGLNPPTHGVVTHNRVLGDDLVTMAELFADAGYETQAFVTITTVSSLFGFDQGFDSYVEMLEREDLPGLHEPASTVVDRALGWLDARGESERPFLLYLHVSDPHAPYVPPSPFAERFAPGVAPIDEVAFGAASPEQLGELIAAASDLYDAEVAYVDEQFGRLVEGLAQRGLIETATILLVGDHGEEFLEHGAWAHGRSLHRELVNVPLILKAPGPGNRTGRVAGRVRQTDVLPTLLQINGIQLPDGLQGESLLAPQDGYGRTAYGHLRVRGRYEDSIAERQWKLLVSDYADGPRRLFDVANDPRERTNLAARFPIRADYLAGRIRELERRFAAAALGPSETELDPETEARLRALGYIR